MPKSDWEIRGTIAEAERKALLRALKLNQFNISRAAAALGIGRGTAYAFIKRYKVDLPATRGKKPLDAKRLNVNRQRIVEDDRSSESRCGSVLRDLLSRKPGCTEQRLARGFVAARQRAVLFFDEARIGNSDLDILLHIFASEAENVNVNVASCARAIRATFPKTSRRVELMEAAGLISIRLNPADARASLLTLTELARMQLEAYLADIV